MTAYARVLGADLEACDPEVQALHRDQGAFSGTIRVERPANPVLRFLGSLAGFPPAGTSDFILSKQANHGGDRWVRTIGAFTMTTYQDARDGLLCERMGPVTACTRLDVS